MRNLWQLPELVTQKGTAVIFMLGSSEVNKCLWKPTLSISLTQCHALLISDLTDAVKSWLHSLFRSSSSLFHRIKSNSQIFLWKRLYRFILKIQEHQSIWPTVLNGSSTCPGSHPSLASCEHSLGHCSHVVHLKTEGTCPSYPNISSSMRLTFKDTVMKNWWEQQSAISLWTCTCQQEIWNSYC